MIDVVQQLPPSAVAQEITEQDARVVARKVGLDGGPVARQQR